MIRTDPMVSPDAIRLFLVHLLLLAGCGGGSPAREAPSRPAAPRPEPAEDSGDDRRHRVLVVTSDGHFLQGALLADPQLDVETLTPALFDQRVASSELPVYDLVILDDHTPAILPPPPLPLLYFHPQGQHSPFAIAGERQSPRVTSAADRHPVLRWVDLSKVQIDATAVFALDPARGDVAIATSGSEPLIAARRGTDRRVIACGFQLDQTDLVLRVAFPLFLSNSVRWLTAR